MNRRKRGEDKRSDGALPSETSYASAEERRAKDRSGQEFAVLHLAPGGTRTRAAGRASKRFRDAALPPFPYLFPDKCAACENIGLAADSVSEQPQEWPIGEASAT